MFTPIKSVAIKKFFSIYIKSIPGPKIDPTKEIIQRVFNKPSVKSN